MKRPDEQWEAMERARVRTGWTKRRPESDIETEMQDERKGPK